MLPAIAKLVVAVAAINLGVLLFSGTTPLMQFVVSAGDAATLLLDEQLMALITSAVLATLPNLGWS